MKKMKILGVCICLAMAGCTDFLEPKSSDEYIPENATSLDEMLVGEAYPLREGQSLFLFHNALDDDITVTKEAVGFQDYEQTEMENFYAVYTLQPDMFVKLESQASNLQNNIAWDKYYERILGANAALDYVEDMNDDIEMKMFVKAQALALRGFYYFHLVNLFGAPYHYDKEALGVPLKLSSDLEIGSRGRNRVSEVYAQILQDFEASKQLFSVLPARRQFARNYRISLPAVRLLEARTYLFMENWEKAIEQAEVLLSDSEFELYDLNSFTSTANNPKPHYSNYDNPEVIWLYGGTSDFLRFVNTTAYGLGGAGTSGRRFFNASSELLAAYEAEDLRKELYMLEEYDKTVPLGNK
ncbi:MAG: RagB/SusD family nutrient uptake outer membrane protein, partial [Odoribacter sp.]|nr:RagB/SusD family nutrient uptake outer membrane protein [Odoribacter sp.]